MSSEGVTAMAGADIGRLAPAGTQMIASNVWFEGNVESRPGTTFTTQSINGNGNTPTIAATAGAGTTATITAIKAHDVGGSFTINSSGTGQAAGSVATVTFAASLPSAPASVVVSAIDTTSSVVINMGAGSLTTTGFTVYSAILTAAHSYLVSYQVIAS